MFHNEENTRQAKSLEPSNNLYLWQRSLKPSFNVAIELPNTLAFSLGSNDATVMP